MPVPDLAIPTLPSSSLVQTVRFYRRLGFSVVRQETEPDPYVIMRRGTIELHFFEFPELDADTSHAGCYWRVEDVHGIYRQFSEVNLPEDGIPRMSSPELKPWGMREFHLVDPDGNLMRIGQQVGED